MLNHTETSPINRLNEFLLQSRRIVLRQRYFKRTRIKYSMLYNTKCWNTSQGNNTTKRPGLEVIKLEFIIRLKIKHNDWLLADTCPQSANHSALF